MDIKFWGYSFALEFPGALWCLPVVTPPERNRAPLFAFPDPNLRAAIAEALGKNPNALITVEGDGRIGSKLDAEAGASEI